MVPAILGRKVGMTQIYEADGKAIPVTVIEAGPCVVTQVKTADGPDGYDAVQIGFEDKKPHRSSLAEIGHCKAAQTSPKVFTREIRLAEPTEKAVGDVITVETFTENEVQYVDISGVTRGKGFQGGMKRWGFGGQPASHGTERKHRSPGSIGGRAANLGTGRNKKGIHMAGQDGHVNRRQMSLKVVGVDPEHNVLWVKGSIPGPKGSFVVIRKAKMRS
jgi:large subunit ribosomal protein L3